MRVYPFSSSESPTKESHQHDELARFSVLYARASTRKHRKWEGDGLLICYPHCILLKSDDDANVISRSTGIKKMEELVNGFILKMGSLEVEIQDRLDEVVTKTNVKPSPGGMTPFKPFGLADVTRQILKRSAESNQDAPTPKRLSKGFVCPFRSSSNEAEKKPEVPSKAHEKENNVAAIFANHLRQHQKEGVYFIFTKLMNSPGGAILADEMGLGKSVQTLAAIYSMMENKIPPTGSIRKCLLVVPSSLVNNWKAEFKKWFKNIRLPVIDMKKACDLRTYSIAYKYSPFLLISYDMALRTKEQLANLQFDVMICDEGHRLKNVNSKLRTMLAELNVPKRLLLTGTPVQNDIDEFYSLLDFVRPGVFGTLSEFKKQCAENSKILADCIDKTILRRTGEVNRSNLPQKHEYVIFCRSSPIQKAVSIKLCEYMTGEPLVIIDSLRKLSNHPALLYKSLSDKATQNQTSAPLLSTFPRDFGDRPISVKDSGKLVLLSEMLVSFRVLGECAVVVSNFTKSLDMISGLCTSLGLQVLRLDGTVAVNERQRLVNKFNNEKDPKNVFLLSTKAGGVGLNLIAASRLVLFDSDWNPALDLQAMGRIWRDGQIRPCHIFRLCTASSIDEKILQRQVKKTGLSSILGAAFETSNNVKFSDEDLMDIFSVLDSDCNTHDLLDCKCQGTGRLPNECEDETLAQEESLEDDKDLSPDILDSGENVLNMAEEALEEAEKESNETAGPVSMGELFSWRHFSPSSPDQWNAFLATSGLKNSGTLTFAFYLTSQF